MYPHTIINLKLTFASLDALKPPVISVFVAGASTILIPSTATSATTDSTGFSERAALRARYRISDRCGHGWRDEWRGDWSAGY